MLTFILSHAQDLILDMIKLDPLQRKSASDYLTHSTGPSNIFPPLFRDLLHSYLSSLLHPPRDQLASYQYQSPYHKKLLASEADFRVEKVWKELGAVLDVAGANGRPASVQRLTAWDLVTRLGDVGVPGCSLKAVAEMEGAAVGESLRCSNFGTIANTSFQKLRLRCSRL
jgi:hypothetical protein